MTHEEFAEKILKAMGGIPSIAARPFYAELLRTRGFEIWLRWEWVTHPDFWQWVDGEKVDMMEGEEWVFIFTYEDQRVPI